MKVNNLGLEEAALRSWGWGWRGMEQTLWKSGGRKLQAERTIRKRMWLGWREQGRNIQEMDFLHTEKKERQMVMESLGLEKKTAVSKALAESSNFGDLPRGLTTPCLKPPTPCWTTNAISTKGYWKSLTCLTFPLSLHKHPFKYEASLIPFTPSLVLTIAPPCLNKGNLPPLKSSPFLPWPELYSTDGNSLVVRWLVRTPCFHAEGASEGLGSIAGGILEN